MLRLAPATVSVLAGDGGITQILYADLVSHEKAAINREFTNHKTGHFVVAEGVCL